MTFIEAVQALKDGKADSISREAWDKSSRSYQFRNNGHGTLVNGHGSGPVQLDQILATDWVLLKVNRKEIFLSGSERANKFYQQDVNYNGPVRFFAEWVE